MGLDNHYLDFIMRHIEDQFRGRDQLRMLELGDQIIVDNPKYPSGPGKKYFESLNYYHTSVDINGLHGAEVRDLTQPDQFLDLHDTFDILTNSGTTEHVEPYASQYECWRILHDCCKTDSVMLHILPDVDEHDFRGHWIGHCPHYYSHKFFQNLSDNCGYLLLESTVIRGHRAVAMKKLSTSSFDISRELLLEGIARR